MNCIWNGAEKFCFKYSLKMVHLMRCKVIRHKCGGVARFFTVGDFFCKNKDKTTVVSLKRGQNVCNWKRRGQLLCSGAKWRPLRVWWQVWLCHFLNYICYAVWSYRYVLFSDMSLTWLIRDTASWYF